MLIFKFDCLGNDALNEKKIIFYFFNLFFHVPSSPLNYYELQNILYFFLIYEAYLLGYCCIIYLV